MFGLVADCAVTVSQALFAGITVGAVYIPVAEIVPEPETDQTGSTAAKPVRTSRMYNWRIPGCGAPFVE